MANPWTGEVAIWVDDTRWRAKLTLGVLAELEARLGANSMIGLVERFESGDFSTRDVLSVVIAGLRGGGWEGDEADMLTSEIRGGPVEAARVAAELLARAFHVPNPTSAA
ncbi:gene transfer agent family protein [Paracoccus pacificus]|uniref:Gene transfer agent family protein n=1 Tax=Paracoccus pacificus TaxID=1463598 RepID=A0ABW4R8L9_9RHOB